MLSGGTDSDIHLFVADVIKSFDTVDRDILDRVLSSLGLPGWFRHAYLEYHAHVRLRFKLAAGLGEPWTRDGGIPQGCPLSMMFIVALYLPFVGIWLLRRGWSRSYMLMTLSVSLGILFSFCVLLSSPLAMFGWLVRSLLPVSVLFKHVSGGQKRYEGLGSVSGGG